jgi:hypothetical protein
VRFVAPDGTPFVLIADPAFPLVHWAIASSLDAADEPPGFEGLAWTVLQASLNGTWNIGSRDAVRERQALAQLDEAWQRTLRDSRDPAVLANVRRCDDEAHALADPRAFGRALAAAPAHRPEVLQRGAAGVFVVTTLPGAIGEVGRLLVERRDEQALRELARTWLQTFADRASAFASDSRRPVHAELLALSLPDQVAARALAAPTAAVPTREQALATWARTQRPERTVHVLLGGFRTEAVQATLTEVFARTSLPAVPPPAASAARPLAGPRRSSVAGVTPPVATVAWLMPRGADRFVLAVARQWLAGGAGSMLARDFERQGRKGAAVRALAPWPPTVGGPALFVVEATDPAGIDGLADRVLAACRAAAEKAADADSLLAATAALQRDWCRANGEPRELAAEIAAAFLVAPEREPATTWPPIDAKAVQDLLARTFAGHPVIVEGRP